MDDFERKITEAIFLDTLLEIIKSPSFEYIFGFKIDPGSITLADTTFKRIIERRIDFGIIAKIVPGSFTLYNNLNCNIDKIFIQFEIQIKNDPDMPLRMHNYWYMIRRKYKMPVLQVVFYVGKSKLNMLNNINELGAQHKFAIIDINKIDRSLLLKQESTIILSLLAINGFSLDNVERVIKFIKSIKNPSLRKKKLGEALTFAGLRKDGNILVDKLNEDMAMSIDIDDVKDSYLFRMGFENARLKFKEELAKAKAEALAKAKAEALVKAKAEALAKIHEKEIKRSINKLHKIKSMSVKEIAEVFECSVYFVRKCLEK